jgi:hypothetical protein
MKSRLFPSGGVALVVNRTPLLTPHAPCQTKKSIDFICYVMGEDWYNALPPQNQFRWATELILPF